ncbi:MAG TPA: hybrid sensor histidine kinase/response regulator [Vicinamibacterales bacterium]|nr:hybrid sensor histidine kinase/response regulator [Vicinamibacterales bacterium]
MSTGGESPPVAVCAPVGRDGPITRDLLQRIGVPSVIYPSLTELAHAGLDEAGALLLTEEALEGGDAGALVEALAAQPAWSDIPVLVFAGGQRAPASSATMDVLTGLTNVTTIERPVRVAAVYSIVRAALRARARQYEMRDVLVSLYAARKQAEEASRLKDEFLATLSHELRTPLNAILGWTALLRKDLVAPDRIPRVLEIVERNARAQAQLVSDVLEVSRMITGKIRLNLQTVSVSSIVSDAIDTVRPGADAKGVAIEFARPQDALIVTGDAERLQQVVWNLLSNAVKFTPSGGVARVGLSRSGDGIEIVVSDTGIGLSAEFLPHVFERFRQADQSFTRAHGGLGLGLAIVKQVVELHGGEVSAASEGTGRGAVFRVRLPIAGVAAEPLPPAALEDEERPLPDLSGRLVLVVDDDDATRELMLVMLTQRGARVTTAASAREAIARIDEEVPSLIVADVGMPGEDGLSMLRRLRRRRPRRGGRVPAIALSAYTRAEDRAAARAAGFDAFVPKPAVPSQLLEAIRETLDAPQMTDAS